MEQAGEEKPRGEPCESWHGSQRSAKSRRPGTKRQLAAVVRAYTTRRSPRPPGLQVRVCGPRLPAPGGNTRTGSPLAYTTHFSLGGSGSSRKTPAECGPLPIPTYRFRFGVRASKRAASGACSLPGRPPGSRFVRSESHAVCTCRGSAVPLSVANSRGRNSADPRGRTERARRALLAACACRRVRRYCCCRSSPWRGAR